MDTFSFNLVLLIVVAIGVILAIRRKEQRTAREQQAAKEALLQQQAEAAAALPPRTTFNAFDLRPNRNYRVVTRFLDHDRDPHEVGERWKFVGKAFLPYEDGLSLFVEQDGRQRHIRMQCRKEEQGPIVNAFSDYVVEE